MEVVDLNFALLRSLFDGTALTAEVKNELNAKTLERLYTLSRRHDIAHLLALALERNGCITEDTPFSEELVNQQQLAVYRYERIRYECEELYCALEEAGIDFLPMKGAVLRALYPEPWMRTSCDIDLLVREADLDRTVNLLEKEKEYVNRGKAFHDVSLKSPTNVHLELHFSICENDEKIDGLLRDVWQYAVPVDGTKHRYELKNEYLFFHVIAHAYYHFLSGGCGIRFFLDLKLMREKLTYEKAWLLERLKECGLAKFYEEVCTLSEVWFGAGAPSEVTQRLERYVLRGGVYGSVENHVSVGQQRKGGKFRYAMSRIFLPYKSLVLLYPKLKNRKWLTPFYQVRRWFRIVFCGRLKSSVRELNANANTSKEYAEETKRLLKDLDLT